MKPLYRDEHPIRFWYASEFNSPQEVMEHVAAGGVRVVQAQASAPRKSSETEAVRGGPRVTS